MKVSTLSQLWWENPQDRDLAEHTEQSGAPQLSFYAITVERNFISSLSRNYVKLSFRSLDYWWFSRAQSDECCAGKSRFYSSRRTFSLNASWSMKYNLLGICLHSKKIQLKQSTKVQRPTLRYWDYTWELLGRLTFASVLVEGADPAPVVDERPVVEEEGGGTVREGPVVQVVQAAVVLGPVGRAEVEVGPAEELRLYLTSSLTGGRTVGLAMISIALSPSPSRLPSAPCRCRSGRWRGERSSARGLRYAECWSLSGPRRRTRPPGRGSRSSRCPRSPPGLSAWSRPRAFSCRSRSADTGGWRSCTPRCDTRSCSGMQREMSAEYQIMFSLSASVIISFRVSDTGEPEVGGDGVNTICISCSTFRLFYPEFYFGGNCGYK